MDTNTITIDVKQGEKTLENLKIPISGSGIGELLASLQTAKNDSNAFLTTLVNQEKDVQSRKHEEMESSDEDASTSKDTNKKLKT